MIIHQDHQRDRSGSEGARYNTVTSMTESTAVLYGQNHNRDVLVEGTDTQFANWGGAGTVQNMVQSSSQGSNMRVTDRDSGQI